MEEKIVILKQYMEENHLFENHKQKHPLFFNSRNEKLFWAGVTYIYLKSMLTWKLLDLLSTLQVSMLELTLPHPEAIVVRITKAQQSEQEKIQ